MIGISSHPLDAVVFIGDMATFTVVAVGSGVTYQWYKNGAAVSGETGASYLFFPDSDEDGARVYCIVTNIDGSVQSRSAVLEVVGNPTVITKDQYFVKEQPAKSEEVKNRIEVPTNPLKASTTLEELYRSGDPITLNPGESLDIQATYSNPPALVTGASISIVDASGATLILSDVTYYAVGAEFTISNTDVSAGTGTVVIQGYPLESVGKDVIVAEDADSILDNGLQKYVFPENPLIQSREIAQTIADALLASYREFRKDVMFTWRGNPVLELGDTITIPQYERGANKVLGTFKIFKNKINFDGTLEQTTEARKVT